MLVLQQWLAGRDFAQADPQAAQMVNFVYLIGDTEQRRAWLVDPAWDVDGLVARVAREGFELAGALLTHWHPDHAGGDLWGLVVEGAAELHRRTGAAIHAHRLEVPWLGQSAGLAAGDLTPFEDDEGLTLGAARVRCVHAPGHTPGSTCYLVTDAGAPAGRPGTLLSGDVLFVGACGRVDLPGSDPSEMFRTLNERLAALPPETVLYPGHDYGPRPSSTLGEERRTNPSLRASTLDDWLALHG
jgi:glyoxylase-like metal-dependent hydrolase (beta-lactamase superfamily II)